MLQTHPDPTSVHRLSASRQHPGTGYVLALLGTAAAVALAALAEHGWGVRDLSLFFVLAVLMVASHSRTGPAVLTAVLCFLAYNYFFIAPRYTFYIHDSDSVATVVVFLAVALLAGRMASRQAMQLVSLREAAIFAAARQQLARRLAVACSEDEVVEATKQVFETHLAAEVWFRLPTEPQPAMGGQQRDYFDAGWWFLDVQVEGRKLGEMSTRVPLHLTGVDQGRQNLILSMVDDIAQSLLRVQLAAELQAQRVAGETERLRNALMASVSHDLRSPLAAIIGSASSLEHFAERMSDDDRAALATTIRSEGERLDRYIQNLLDMTRLGHGTLALNRDWVAVDELVSVAVDRIHRYIEGAQIDTRVPANLPPLWVHAALLEQALFNCLENACKFSPKDAKVLIGAKEHSDGVQIDIVDHGPGIPEHERSRVFDLFYSVQHGDRGRHGTGLGLTIAQGMVGAHGGSIKAMAGDSGTGTRICIRLPRIVPPESIQ